MTTSAGNTPTIVAVDWSGARDPSGQRAGICTAIADGAGVESSAGRTRLETIDLIAHLSPPLVIGFDFSFGVPEWFARANHCTTIDDVWQRADEDGEQWLLPTPPFWSDRLILPRERRFRRCELALSPAKSIFQLVGNGQVGRGSVRGMPLLARLRATGFAIWPFDAATDRTVVEIYPTRLRPLVAPSVATRAWVSLHERDAVESARVMWEHRESFADLAAATDPVTKIEGDVWMPT